MNFSPAQRQIKKLDASLQKMIIQKLESLRKNPRPHDVKKMTGLGYLYRMRIRDYRILYIIDNHSLTVLVVKIGHREEIYKLVH